MKSYFKKYYKIMVKLYCKSVGAHGFKGPSYETEKNGDDPCCICGEPIKSLPYMYFLKPTTEVKNE